MMMNEKQFVLYEHKEDYYILKNPRLHLDFIEMLGDALTSEEIVEELNQLNDKVVELTEENEQLRQFINKGRRLSVKELMDNINENELLKKKIRGLEKENEQLKKGGKE